MERIESKMEFNDRLYREYPSLTERCGSHNMYMEHNVSLVDLSTVVGFRSDTPITNQYIISMNDDTYFGFLNELLKHIQKNGGIMLEFWLL